VARGEQGADQRRKGQYMTDQDWLQSDDPAAMLECVTFHKRQVGWGCVSDRKLRLFAVACCRQVWHLLTDERSRRAVEVAERYADGDGGGTSVMHRAREEAWMGKDMHDNQPWALALSCCHHQAYTAAQDCRAVATNGRLIPPATQAALLREIVGNPFRRQEEKRLIMEGRWVTKQVFSLAEAAYAERIDNTAAIAETMKGIETLNFIMARCYSDSAYRGYQANLDQHHNRLKVLQETPNGTLDHARLAVLSDALEEAGCDDADVLNHLRGKEQCPGLPGRRCMFGMLNVDTIDPNERCPTCKGKQWIDLRGSHVRGCWALDLVLGKE
jgi:hypothetical protein